MTDIKILLPHNIIEGLYDANNPSASNPFATLADVSAGGIGGGGTQNQVARFTPDGTHVGDSQIFDDGFNVYIPATGGGLLIDGSSGNSLDWINRMLYDTSAGSSIDYESRIMYDDDSTPSIDWDDRIATDETDAISFNYSTRKSYDSDQVISIDWENRNLIDNVSAVSLAWLNRGTYDSDGVQSIDWGSSTGTGRFLIGITGENTLDWGQQFLYDSNQVISIAWQSRILKDDQNNPVINWVTGTKNTLFVKQTFLINAKTVALNTGFTFLRNFVITQITERLSAASVLTILPTRSIGVTSGNPIDLVISGQPTGLTAVNKINNDTIVAGAGYVDSGSNPTVYYKITTGATATSATIEVTIIGYYVS